MQIIENRVLAETMEAYCDSRLPWEQAQKRRNLNFRASATVTRDEAVRIAERAIPGGYNEFEAKLLAKLPADSLITFAREGSVCVYVFAPLRPIKGMRASEWDVEGDMTRIWWD